MGKITFYTLAILVGCLLAGCAGSQRETAAGATSLPALERQLTDSFGLPSPSELRAPSYLESDLVVPGRDFATELNNRNVEAVGDTAVFSPAWDEMAPDNADLAVALYEVLLGDYDRDYVLKFTWGPVGDQDDAWIGFANFGSDRWDWNPLPGNNTLAFDGGDHVYYPGGRLVVAVAFTGTIPWQLNQLRIGTPVELLDPPANLAASDGTTYKWVVVSWERSLGALIYEVYRDVQDEPVAVLGDEDTWLDNEVPQVEEHTYWVRAVNEAGLSDFSNSDTGFRAEGPPDPPTNVQASDGLYPERVVLTWTKSLGATGYNIYRDWDWNKLIELGDTDAYEDYSLMNTLPHDYWVTATNEHGESELSEPDPGYLSEEAPPPPDPPANVQATDGTHDDKIVITWDKSDTAESYDIYRDLEGFPTFTDVGDVDSFDDDTVTDTDVHTYWVRATHRYGEGDKSAPDTGYRAGQPPLIPPTDLAATDGDHTDKIVLTWTKSAGATGYEIYRDLQGIPHDTVGDVDTYDDTIALDTSVHTYWLKAINLDGESDYSLSDTGYRAPDLPDPPTDLAASDGSFDDRIRLTWTKSPGATGYKIYRDQDDNLIATVGDEDTYDDIFVAPDYDEHTYWLRAVNDDGDSGLSDPDTGYAAPE